MTSKASIIIGFLLFNFIPTHLPAQQQPADHAKAVINPAFLKETITHLASDSMKGRATPSAELDEAGDFIARQFASYGLQPLGNSFFQDLDFCYFELGSSNFLALVDGLETINFKIGDNFVPYQFTGSRPVEGGLVFAGYGITAPEYKYDDYKDMDVKGKIVVVLRHEPGQTDSTVKIFEGMKLTRYSWLREKQKMAMDHGAAALLVISGPLQFSASKQDAPTWSSISGAVPKDAPMDYCGKPGETIPMVHAGDSVVKELFGSVDSLRHLQERIEKTLQPLSFRLPGRTAAMNVSIKSTPVGGRNVIAWLEGSDPDLKGEAIVIGGHYDHIGYQEVHEANADYIYNGADDNASGTSGVLAIAKAFASMQEKPRRSVIFIAFAGEERGLLGSNTYVKKPPWPLEKTVAMLNLDMIGRNDPSSLEIIGARQSPRLAGIIRKRNRDTGFDIDESNSSMVNGGSDHAPFYRRGIPAIFFFTGLHQDYHKVTDNPDRIDADKAARVARLAFLTAWTVANESRHYKAVKRSGKK